LKQDSFAAQGGKDERWRNSYWLRTCTLSADGVTKNFPQSGSVQPWRRGLSEAFFPFLRTWTKKPNMG
jgi:hypothetical protein